MRKFGWKFGGLCGAVGVLASGVARGENLQHFEPAPGPTGGFTLEDHRTPGHLRLLTDVYVNYGREPLVLVDAKGGGEQQIVGHMTTFDLVAGVTLIDRLMLSVDLPLNHILGDGAREEEQEGFTLGDLRVEPRGRILGEDEGLGLALAVPVSLPTGNQYGHTSAGMAVFNPKAIVGYDFGALDAYVNLGARFATGSETIDGSQTKVGSAVTYTAGLGYTVGHLRVIGEGFGTVPLEDATKKTTANPLEALAGVRWGFGHGLHLNGGGGLGIIGDAGTPAFRILLGVGYTSGTEASETDEPTPAVHEEVAAEDHAAAAEAEQAAAAPPAEEPMYAEAGELEAAVAEAERPKRATDAVAPVAVAANDEHATDDEDDEPPPNHGKKRRGAKATPDDDEGESIAEEPPPPKKRAAAEEVDEEDEDAAPPPKKKPKPAPVEEAEDGALDVHSVPGGRVLALGMEGVGQGKKGGHKKRPSVFFGAGVVTLDARAQKELDRVVALFAGAPKNAKLRISGHSDNSLPAATSLQHSKSRVQAAKAYLVAHGVPAKRIVVEWYGDTAPIGKNKTEAGRSVNRRVDYAFVVYDE